MIVYCISDIHACLPQIEECDLLLIAGDICNGFGYIATKHWHWIDRVLRPWLRDIPAKHVIATLGNHDHLWYEKPDMVPKDLRWNLLIDQETHIYFDSSDRPLRIYGTPWTLWNGGWSYNETPKEIGKWWEKIPEGIDILLCHQPPYGLGDRDGLYNLGCPQLKSRIEKVKPKLVVTGHIHKGYGVYHHEGITIANAAVGGHHSTIVNPILRFDILEDGTII